MVESYAPTWWAANAHLQILLTFVVPQARVAYERELLTLRDGGQAALDWALAASDSPLLPADAPVAVVLHGLTGSSDDMRSLCAAALARGYRPVVVNKRGHGGVKLATPKLQAFGCVADLSEALAHIEQTWPRAKQRVGIGLSAGAGLLVSYLGETGEDSALDAAVLVSPGYDAHYLFCGGGMHPVYDFLMTFALKALLLRHVRELKGVIDVPGALSATSIRAFDANVFAKMHGFEGDLDGYWRENNPVRALSNVARPVLCINALDDPVCTRDTILYDQFERNPRAMLLETAHGSHCAFFHGPKPARSWANDAALAYLDLVRGFNEQQAASAPAHDSVDVV